MFPCKVTLRISIEEKKIEILFKTTILDFMCVLKYPDTKCRSGSYINYLDVSVNHKASWFNKNLFLHNFLL